MGNHVLQDGFGCLLVDDNIFLSDFPEFSGYPIFCRYPIVSFLREYRLQFASGCLFGKQVVRYSSYIHHGAA